MNTLTWLHISDLHFRTSQTFDTNIVLQALLHDITERIQDDGLQPDFIAFTGDVAFGGKPNEYAMAQDFFDELLTKTNLSRDRLFIIPGNHDIDRDLVTAGAHAIGGSLNDRSITNQVLNTPSDCQLLFERFNGYAEFVNHYLGGHLQFDDEHYFHVRTLDLAGQRIALLGLNTAWLCASDEDKANGLLIGERQVRTALEEAENTDLKIALVHHPFDWLREFDQNDSVALLLDNCDFVLHGHLHHPAIKQLSNPDSSAMILAAGACYETREYPNTYSFVRLYFTAGIGTVYLRRYSDERGGFWAKDTLTYKNVPDGEYTFSLHGNQRIPVGELINNQLYRQLTKEKNSKKYIPDIFVEVAKVKEQARFFAHPTLFFQKVLDEVERLNFSDVNRILRKLSLQPIQLSWQHNSNSEVTIDSIDEYTRSLSKALNQIREVIFPYSDYCSANLPEATSVPSDKQYIYKDMKYLLEWATSRVMRDIDELLENLEFISSRILFVVARAGQGKTNFVCDLAETVLARRSIPCAFFTGREFNNVTPEQIGEYFVKSIFSDRVNGLDETLDHLSKFAVEANAPVVIIIDGINEHKNIQAFSHHLEKFVEKVLEYKHIKIILTCRLEYFEERFSNFKQASFSQEIRFIDDLERHMSEMHKDQMVEGYFRFFKLRYPYISKHAAEVLENDTLLLRMFCEAYRDVNAEEEIQLPQIVDLYREKIFRKYLKQKIEDASEYDEDSSRIRIRRGEKYHQVLKHIIELMVQRKQYADIPIADLSTEYDDALGSLLGEDVIIRKDLVNVDGVFDNRVEVINFTFNEFRDFLLAKHLVSVVFQQNQQRFEEIVNRIVAPKSPVAEGVGTYLFLASKRPSGKILLEVIGEKEWYRNIFVKSIFSVEEKFITQDDLNEIKARFNEDERTASWIIRMLVQRWRTNWYPQLNIRLLFEIFNELDEDAYEKLVEPSVKNGRSYDFNASYIKRLTDQLEEDLDSKKLNDADFINLMELLIYFFPIWGGKTFSLLAFDTFSKFTELKPDVAITLLRKHTQIIHLGIRTQVWRMLAYITKIGEIPTELVEEACQLLLEIGENEQPKSDSLAKEIVRFLETYAIEKKLCYMAPVVEQMKRHTLFPYFYEKINDIGT